MEEEGAGEVVLRWMGQDQEAAVAAVLRSTLVVAEEVVEEPSSCSGEAAGALAVVGQQLKEVVVPRDCSAVVKEEVLPPAPWAVEAEVRPLSWVLRCSSGVGVEEHLPLQVVVAHFAGSEEGVVGHRTCGSKCPLPVPWPLLSEAVVDQHSRPEAEGLALPFASAARGEQTCQHRPMEGAH